MGDDSGGQRGAALYSLIGTAKLNGIDASRLHPDDDERLRTGDDRLDSKPLSMNHLQVDVRLHGVASQSTCFRSEVSPKISPKNVNPPCLLPTEVWPNFATSPCSEGTRYVLLTKFPPGARYELLLSSFVSWASMIQAKAK